jgi:hypothetical protein
MANAEALLDGLGYEVAGKFTLFRAGGYARFKVPCIANRLSSADPATLAEILSAILNHPVTPQQFIDHQHHGPSRPASMPPISSRLHEASISRPPLYWEITSLRFARGDRPAEIAISGGTFSARFARLPEQQRSGFAFAIADGSATFQGVTDLANLAAIVTAAYGIGDPAGVARILNVGTLFDPPPQVCRSPYRAYTYEPSRSFSARQHGRARRNRFEWRPDDDG